jgi:hypothetical protein
MTQYSRFKDIIIITACVAKLKLGEFDLEIVEAYDYLGVSIKYNSNISPKIAKLCKQVNRAIYALIGKSRKLGLSVDMQLHLFDLLVVPIALYGSEIWGCKNSDVIEQMHLKFLRMLLKVNKSTPKCMLYGELGRMPLKYNIDTRMLNFWYRIISGNKRKISYHIYQLLYSLDKSEVFHSDWISKIKEVLVKCNLYDTYWVNQENISNISLNEFKQQIKKNLSKNYEQLWLEKMHSSSKCSLYREFKHDLKLEKYLVSLEPKLRYSLTKYRLSNHRLPIEVGRYHNAERSDRACEFCSSYDIGDEYHYFIVCPKFASERSKLIPKNCVKKPSVQKCCDLMSTKSINTFRKLATLSKIVMDVF